MRRSAQFEHHPQPLLRRRIKFQHLLQRLHGIGRLALFRVKVGQFFHEHRAVFGALRCFPAC